jgi:WD40 repeat protein
VTGERKALLQHAPPRGVSRLALSPEGKTIAAAEVWREGEKGPYKRRVTLWDLASCKVKASLAADESTSALAFSPDGKVLAWSAYVLKDNKLAAVEVRRHDLTSGSDLPALSSRVSKYPLSCIAFSPDGRALAGAEHQGQIVLWDTASAKVRRIIKQEETRRITSLAFAPDGRTLAAALAERPGRGREPGLIVLWDAATGEHRMELTGHANAVLTVAFSPDGRLLASGSSDNTVRLWDVTAPAAAGVESERK